MPETHTKLDSVHWRINCQCDVRCAYCFEVEQLHEINPDASLPVLDKMIEHGIRTFVLTGGEPLLSKRIDRVVRHLHESGAKIVLHTNCQFWDFHDEVLTECVDTICVPIEGASEHVHDSVRGRDNMRAVQSVIRRYATKDGPFKVRVGTVIGRHNLNDLEGILYVLDTHEIEAWTLYKHVRYTDRTVQSHFRKAQLGISAAEYEFACSRVLDLDGRKTPILLSADQESSGSFIMLNPELEIAVPTTDDSGVLVDQVICRAEEHSMSVIEDLWHDSVDWERYRSTLRVSL